MVWCWGGAWNEAYFASFSPEAIWERERVEWAWEKLEDQKGGGNMRNGKEGRKGKKVSNRKKKKGKEGEADYL